MYSLNMMEIALMLAEQDSVYHELVTKFFEHFALIAEAANKIGLWNEEDGFFYDVLRARDGTGIPMRVRSVVGLLPLVATTSVSAEAHGRGAGAAQAGEVVLREPERTRPTLR